MNDPRHLRAGTILASVFRGRCTKVAVDHREGQAGASSWVNEDEGHLLPRLKRADQVTLAENGIEAVLDRVPARARST